MQPSSITPKKSLGQNFLQDPKALQTIVEAANLSPQDTVLEIGPGTGVLTKELVKRAGKVITIEKDEKLADFLQASFQMQKDKSADAITIIADDILTINLPQLLEKHNVGQYKVVANIPYYITGQILRLLLETKYSPTVMVLLVQKEVAERICAKPGDMSILAVSVQYYGTPQYVATVPKTSFDPAPEVDSAIVKITLNSESADKEATKQFFKLVKIGFSSRRKTLINNLANGLKKEKGEIEQLLSDAGMHPNVRAQELSVEDWKTLNTLFNSSL